MPFAFEWLYRRLGWRYFWAYAVFNLVSSFFITLGTLFIFSLYTDTSDEQFWRAFVISEVAVLIGLVWVMLRVRPFVLPMETWLKSGQPADDALDVWERAAALPRDFVLKDGWQVFVIIGIPIAVLVTIDFYLPWYSAIGIFVGSCVATAYASILHFFASELALRPILRDAAAKLPRDFGGMRLGVPLRWKLLGALPLINVITGVVVSGLSSSGNATLRDLGVDVLVAVAVAFTVSLELTVLLARSIYEPVTDLT